MNKFKISHLKAMKKADLFSLCLAEFGNDTTAIYQHYTKAEMISDLMTVTTPDEVAVTDTAEPDDMEMVFNQPHYLDCVAYVWICHALELDPYDGYSFNANELDTKFIDYMFERGNYDELFWECLPSDVAQYLNDIEL